MEARTYTRTAADPTKYLYNAGAEKNDYTSYYETFYRNYDASIGRFGGVDVAVAKYASVTPYNYALNDPIGLNDPLGDDPDGGVITLTTGITGVAMSAAAATTLHP